MSDYRAMIESKQWKAPADGFEPDSLNPALFDWQRALVRWACRKGRAAIFADCGLGKTLMQVAWADAVLRKTGGGPVLILAPLAVAAQTVAEAARFGVTVTHMHEIEDFAGVGIHITNYDRMERFLGVEWAGIVLDESSILKSHTGKFRNLIIESFASVPYKLACTATPSPNDHMELGNHAEFLGVMTRTEMLCSFFVHDGGETTEWRLKGHAERDFWAWVAGWAVMMRKPSDIGFSDDGYTLPDLRIIPHILTTGIVQEGHIFAMPARTLDEQRAARRETMAARIAGVAEMVNASDRPWLVWCELNEEGDGLTEAIDSAVQVAGANTEEEKTDRMLGFATGKYLTLITKPKVAGFGMNWQHCDRIAFVGLSHSYEQFYQSVRRCWRFGQKNHVEVHIMSSDLETEVLDNINRKQVEADKMAAGMIAHMADVTKSDIAGTERQTDEYRTSEQHSERWTMLMGDCVEHIGRMATDSIHYSIFSPPFASLYTYSNSPFDMGNCKNQSEFFAQFVHLTREMHRVVMPGRLVSFHCMNLPTSKERDGFIGITDFRGILIRAFQDAGFIFHSEVCIWKDPVTAMQRTKALGLLHKTIRKDSSMSRQGIPDYLVTMRKPGDNAERIPHGDDLPVSLWQQYASPVWMDITPSDTLQKASAREENDERHICPLQLSVIERAIHLWSNPGDLVLSPFAGIGSEGYCALKMGRRFIGTELKPSYYVQAVANLRAIDAEAQGQQTIEGIR